jgi:hypothetical protein
MILAGKRRMAGILRGEVYWANLDIEGLNEIIGG